MASPTALEPVAASAWTGAEEALYEIVQGQRVELPPMSTYASRITSRLGYTLGPFAEDHKLGTVWTETLFVLDPQRDERRRPDVAFVSVQRWPLERPIPETGDWEVVPDLAVEVISPNDLFEAVVAKVEEYFQFGVRLVWLFLPRRRQVYVYESPTRVHILTAHEELEGGTLLPGFRQSLAAVFQRQTENGQAAVS
jgi:Uma2 family endonuclease